MFLIKRLLRVISCIFVFPLSYLIILYGIVVVPIFWVITGKNIFSVVWKNIVNPYMNFVFFGQYTKII